ncbi:DNA-processing protein DprA [Thiotrichales bacterium 19S11-10]|nr:DNA-processing protein DprA [Thiotrichales bacterium 19S11-10]
MKNKKIKYNEQSLWSILEQINGIGIQLALKIINQSPSLIDFFENIDYFQTKLKLPKQTLIELKSGISKEHANYINLVNQWLDKSNQHHLITLKSPHYPKLLKQIHSPPPVLYIKGNLNALTLPQIAIVGTRNASHYGLKEAFNFAKALTYEQYCITSGLALGIDTQAHLGAVNANGKTIAVMGTGLNHIYPNQNLPLADKILDNHGAIISEFPLNSLPERYRFPRRNRIISGLALGTLVIESSLKSGSLITANYALDQNREVFALPGQINSFVSSGCHKLIREGATLVTNIDEILEEVDPMRKSNVTNSPHKASHPTCIVNKSELNSEQEKILSHINYQNTPIDIIIEGTSIDSGSIHEHLFTLELMQKIETIPGGYRRI